MLAVQWRRTVEATGHKIRFTLGPARAVPYACALWLAKQITSDWQHATARSQRLCAGDQQNFGPSQDFVITFVFLLGNFLISELERFACAGIRTPIWGRDVC